VLQSVAKVLPNEAMPRVAVFKFVALVLRVPVQPKFANP
jgi:hypothetical protein